MLTNPTLQALRTLRLPGMLRAYEEQLERPAVQSLTFDERFGLLVEAEKAQRENHRLERLLKSAHLKASACPEDIDFGVRRHLDKRQVLELLNGQWLDHGQHLLITGATGVGKTWLACALGTAAARKGHTVLYQRFTRLLEVLEIARADGSLPKLRAKLARVKLLILDDWGLASMTPQRARDLLEIIDDRVPGASVLITAQLPTDAWHDYLGDPTIADAVLDRILHNVHRIAIEGESMRRARSGSDKK